MKHYYFAMLFLAFSILACTRSFNAASSPSMDALRTLTDGGMQRSGLAGWRSTYKKNFSDKFNVGLFRSAPEILRSSAGEMIAMNTGLNL